jgi:hypothetical protein
MANFLYGLGTLLVAVAIVVWEAIRDGRWQHTSISSLAGDVMVWAILLYFAGYLVVPFVLVIFLMKKLA